MAAALLSIWFRENAARIRRRALMVLVVALALSLARLAAAAETASPVVTPPQLLESVPIERPDGSSRAGERSQANDPVDVELELTIDGDGAVVNAEVPEPGDPAFDDAALAGVRRFKFEPARRNGVAVPSRVRYRHRFPPAAVSRPAALDSPEARAPPDMAPASVAHTAPAATTEPVTPDSGPDAPPAPLEFGATATVREESRSATRRTVEGSALVDTPGTRGDALRVIELLPGVARPPAGSGQVIVRGSAPFDTEVFFEGSPVLRLYHFGGLTSFVNGRLVDHIDLYPGNFSAKYGRKLGGIVDVGARDPRADGLHLLADVNLIDASVMAEGPVTRSLSIALAARRSYIGDVLASLSSDGSILAAPVYDDYQLFATWRPTERDRVRFLGYGSRDTLALNIKASDHDPAITGPGNQRTYFHRAQVSWEHRYADGISQTSSVAFGGLGFVAGLGDALQQHITGPELFGRSELDVTLSSRLSLATGVDITSQWLSARYHGPSISPDEGDPSVNGPLATTPAVTIDTTALFFRPAVFAEATWRGPGGLTILGGGRGDYFGDIAQYTFDPRVTARLALGESTTLKGGAGLFSQPPNYGQAVPGLGNPTLKAARALHLDLGIERAVGGGASIGIEGFAKRLTQLVVGGTRPGTVENDGVGRIYGLETTAKLAGSRASGFVSYTLSRSERRDHPGAPWRLFDYDQTHILTVAGSLHLGRGWELGGAFRLVSGNPETPVVGSVYDANHDLYRPIYGDVNSARAPLFQRLDLRVEKQWHPGRILLATYLDLQNATNRKNVEATGYGFDYRQRADVYGLPIFPSLGVRGEL